MYLLHAGLSFLLPRAARKEYEYDLCSAITIKIQYEFIRDVYSLNMKITYGKYGFVVDTYNKFNLFI